MAIGHRVWYIIYRETIRFKGYDAMRKLEYTFKTDTLFKAETEEELEKMKEMEVPVMSQAMNAYYTITASSEFREKERLRAKARHDEAQALYNARYEEKLGFARKLLTRNRPIEEIMEDTGLTYEEIEDLRIEN